MQGVPCQFHEVGAPFGIAQCSFPATPSTTSREDYKEPGGALDVEHLPTLPPDTSPSTLQSLELEPQALRVETEIMNSPSSPLLGAPWGHRLYPHEELEQVAKAGMGSWCVGGQPPNLPKALHLKQCSSNHA